MGNESLFDPAIALEQAGGDEELAKRLFGMLLDELPDCRAKLETALKNEDWATLRTTGHSLAGASCYCGVPRLTECAKMVECSTDALIADEAHRLLALIDQLLEQYL